MSVCAGIFITIPANTTCIIFARANYSNVRPEEISITSNKNNKNWSVCSGLYAGVIAQCCCIDKSTSEPKSYYPVVRYSAVSTESVIIGALYFSLN